MNELYRRAMGLPYDEERLAMEAANGLAGGHSYENYELAELQETNAGELSETLSPDSRYAAELQDVRMTLAETSLSFDERIVLEAEEVVLAEQIELETLAKMHPRDASRLQAFLAEELQARAEKGEPIDDQMYIEAEILGELISEANEGADDDALIAIAIEMKALIEAQRQLTDIQEYFELAS